jgi:hypothetical protein
MQKNLKTGLYSKQQNTQMDTNEEFAKLDALLADLLSEVEQPILLNQEGIVTNWDHHDGKTNTKTINPNKCEILKNLDDIERSVDYLNEQKEKLKSKKDFYYQKEGSKDVIFEEEDPESFSLNPPHRKIKSKLDYYVSNSNEQSIDNSLFNKQGFSYINNSNSLNKQHKPYSNSQNSFNQNDQNIFLLIDDNKPPISPNPYPTFNTRNNYGQSNSPNIHALLNNTAVSSINNTKLKDNFNNIILF